MEEFFNMAKLGFSRYEISRQGTVKGEKGIKRIGPNGKVNLRHDGHTQRQYSPKRLVEMMFGEEQE